MLKTARLVLVCALAWLSLPTTAVAQQGSGFSSPGLPLGGAPAQLLQSLPPGVSLDQARQMLRAAQPGTEGPTAPQRSVAVDPKAAQEPPVATGSLEAPRPGTFAFFASQSAGRLLPIYGRSLFTSRNRFEAIESTPVPAEYVIGPGDEIQVKVFGGAVELDQRFLVDRSGAIALPKLGPVSIAGTRVRDLEATLKRAIGRFLTDFNLYAAMGSLRGIEIYVVGHAANPGKYVVSSVSTLINALFASGGPSALGSMRSIELVRENKVIVKVDLYDFLIRGDKSNDIRLLPGDVINVPAAGPQVALVGAIANAAVYEIAPSPRVTSVGELIALAGGLPVVASPLQATLERIEPGRAKPLFATSLSLNEAGLKTSLKDGDMLTIFSIKPAFDNAISLRIFDAPAIRIPITPGAKVSDVIPSREALLTADFWMRRFRSTEEPSQQGVANQSASPSGGASQQARDRDAAGPASSARASAGGRVQQEQTARRIDQMRLASQLDQINWDQAIIERVDAVDLRTKVISFNLGLAILKREAAHDVLLLPGDTISVFSQREVQMPQAMQTRLVQIQGEIRAPGIYQLQPGETLPELIARAGGLTPAAYVYGSELTRVSVRDNQRRNLELVVRRLESQLTAESSTVRVATSPQEQAAIAQLNQRNQQLARDQIERLKAMTPNGRVALEMDPRRQRLPDIALEDGDEILIPKAPGHVSAAGAVYNESALVYRSGRTVADYLRVAGVAESAERDNIFVIRADGSIAAPDTGGTLFSLQRFSARTNIAAIELMPGDTIVVPEKFSKESGYSVFMRELKDWTQVLYQLGLAAAAINTLK